jgi:hypothetical protein
MSTNTSQSPSTCATRTSASQPSPSGLSTAPISDQGCQNSSTKYKHSKVFVRGTEQGFALESNACRPALNPTHAALHTRHFQKIAESLNEEKDIDNEHNFTTRLDTILKTHNKQYPKVCISKDNIGMDYRSKFWAQLDACDTENDILLEIKMRFKERKGLEAAKAAAYDD